MKVKSLREDKCCTLVPKEPSKLRRTLSFWQATICGMGIIIGAGIYALLGVASSHAGPAVWLAFLISGIIATLTGLSYAELSSIFKKNAAEYDYVNKAYGKKIAWVVGSMMVFSALFTAATVSIGFGGYLESITGFSIFWSGVILLVVLTLINLWSINQSAWVNTIFTIIEAGGLLFIIFLGMSKWGSVDLLEMPFGFTGVLRSAALVFFSYIGFESIVKLTEETKNPTKNIPKAVIASVIASTIIYVLVAVSAVSVVSWKVLGASSAPLAEVAGIALGPYTFVILALIALCSTANTVLMDIVTCSRQVYGMAKKGALPQLLGEIHPYTKTPHFAILFVSVVIIFMMLLQDLERLASFANFFTFITFACINLVVIHLRKSYTVKRGFRVPGSIFGVPIVPLLGFLSSIWMLYYVWMGVI